MLLASQGGTTFTGRATSLCDRTQSGETRSGNVTNNTQILSPLTRSWRMALWHEWIGRRTCGLDLMPYTTGAFLYGSPIIMYRHTLSGHLMSRAATKTNGVHWFGDTKTWSLGIIGIAVTKSITCVKKVRHGFVASSCTNRFLWLWECFCDCTIGLLIHRQIQ